MLNPALAFSQRIGTLSESKTNQVFALARQLRQQGKEIYSLAVGEPDFPTPEPIIAATQKALADQQTRYGVAAGLESLRSRLAAERPHLSPENILIANGAKQALFSIFQVLCNPGDEIILPQPCWVSFEEQIKLAGGRPVPVPTDNHQINPDTIKKAITTKTKAILINSPNNPTGAVYSADSLSEVARISQQHNIIIISDEAYHAYTYDGCVHIPMYPTIADLHHVIIVRSFSKQYNMTGFRVGYVVAHKSIIQALTRLQSHLCGNVCTFAQYGALAALNMDQTIVTQRQMEMQRRRDLAFSMAAKLFPCIRPQGAFYLFADITPYLTQFENGEELAMHLLNNAGVAVVPGEAFGGPGHIRISFGADESELRTAFKKIEEVL